MKCDIKIYGDWSARDAFGQALGCAKLLKRSVNLTYGKYSIEIHPQDTLMALIGQYASSSHGN